MRFPRAGESLNVGKITYWHHRQAVRGDFFHLHAGADYHALGVRLSFEHGFIDYIKRGNEQRLMMLGDALADQYEQHGNWDFLRNNNKLVFNILRSLEQNPDASNQLPPHGWRTQFWIIDQQYRVMIGPRAPVPQEGSRRSITTSNGKVVGWVIGSPSERLTRSADINFDQQQKRTSWMIVGLTMLLAAAVTWLLSRGLLAPVKRLVEGTHHLAAGHFTSRVQASSRDELGRLAQDFNRLASTLEKMRKCAAPLWPIFLMSCARRWRYCAVSWKRYRTAYAS